MILAAGKGTRLKSSVPKVLHEVAGRPLLRWVIESARQAGCEAIAVVVGHGADQVRESFAHETDLTWITQENPQGTGHALAQVEPWVQEPATLLVLSGDAPLVTPETCRHLLGAAEASGAAMAVAHHEDPGRLGRVFARNGRLSAIVEAADATPEQLECRLINAGFYALPAGPTFESLRKTSTENAQGELYLTDAVASLGDRVQLVELTDPMEAQGVNTRLHLAAVHQHFIARTINRCMASGVTVLDPDRTVVEPHVAVGKDVVLHPGVHLMGESRVGAEVEVHVGSWIKDCRIGHGVKILPYCVLEGAEIQDGAVVGPFARLRPGAHLGVGSKVGNFVEVKQSEIGEGAKVNHLSYVGDSTVGAGANIGAGVVTCNYDGVRKHRTSIGTKAFVGSGAKLVAPVSVGESATVGAGSVITRNVPDGSLAVERSKTRVIEGWNQRRSKEK